VGAESMSHDTKERMERLYFLQEAMDNLVKENMVIRSVKEWHSMIDQYVPDVIAKERTVCESILDDIAKNAFKRYY